MIWSDVIGRFTHDGRDENGTVVDSPATRACVEQHGVLPLQADFEQGEAHGIREVLPSMVGIDFWSSSLLPGVSEYACGFHGHSGGIAYGYRGYVNSVRCVAR